MPYAELNKAAAVTAGHAAYKPGAGLADFKSFCDKPVSSIICHRLGGSHFGYKLGSHIQT